MIRIDKEFKSLIPPLSDEEFKQLEENILRDGIREPLVMWHVPNGDDIMIDGHNRWEISAKHGGIPFDIKRMTFDTREDVIQWIILNQFGRRNLSAYDRSLLALKLKPVIAEQAKKRQGTRTDKGNIVQKSARSRDEVAEIAGVSHDTIHKVEVIKEKATPQTKQLVRDGKLSINEAYNSVHPKQPHVANNSGDNEWYTPAEYIEAAREVMGSIDLDPASNELANKTVKAQTFYTAEINGLNKEWFGNVWLNPPYSASLVQAFAEKVVSSNFQQAVILVNNATDTAWFRKLIEKANAILFTTGRIRFYKMDGEKGAPLQGQAFIYYGDSVEKFLEVFGKFGWGAML